MNRLLLILLGLTFLTIPGNGLIIESEDFSKIKDYIDDNIFLCVGLDDTLLYPIQTLGSKTWFKERLEHLQNENVTINPQKQVLADWLSIQNVTKMKYVHANNVKILDELRSLNVPILILTDRPLASARRTLFLLNEANIKLTNSFLYPGNRIFRNPNFKKDCLSSLLYQDGVLFTSGLKTKLPMGPALSLFLKHLPRTFNKLVYIDHNEEHIRSVAKTCVKKKIPFVGIRYSYMDKHISQYNSRIASVQWDKISEPLSEEDSQRFG